MTIFNESCLTYASMPQHHKVTLKICFSIIDDNSCSKQLLNYNCLTGNISQCPDNELQKRIDMDEMTDGWMDRKYLH